MVQLQISLKSCLNATAKLLRQTFSVASDLLWVTVLAWCCKAVLFLIANVGIPCIPANAWLTACVLYFLRPSLATWPTTAWQLLPYSFILPTDVRPTSQLLLWLWTGHQLKKKQDFNCMHLGNWPFSVVGTNCNACILPVITVHRNEMRVRRQMERAVTFSTVHFTCHTRADFKTVLTLLSVRLS